MVTPTVFAVFFAGLVSFLSPCILPLVPVYIAYITGVSARASAPLLAGSGALTMADLDAPAAVNPRLHTFVHALFFMIGFMVIFTLLGLSAGALGGILYDQRTLFRQIAGLVLIIFGLHTLGLINIPFLNFGGKEIKVSQRFGYLSSSLIGMGFAIGHLPCIGITMSAVYTLAFDSASLGTAAWLFLVYTIGLGIPFLAVSLAVGSVSRFLKRVTRHSVTWRLGGWTVIRDLNVISLLSGVLLLVIGWVIFTNSIGFFNGLMPQLVNWNV
ncbi:MAG: hypothetical protein DLM69_05120 [Candidatus Chloroheliales bacterium]|nr:MAG: hypothetical protein DLM69_05120 [Chloroflexota bacterium]